MTAEEPSTKKVLKMLDPTTLPIAMSTLFFIAATTDVASSGSDVPMEMIVRAMTRSEMPRSRAKRVAKKTMALPPPLSRSSPARSIRSAFFDGYSFISPSSSVFPDMASVTLYERKTAMKRRRMMPSILENPDHAALSMKMSLPITRMATAASRERGISIHVVFGLTARG